MAPKETNGATNEGMVTPGAQEATSTVPSQIGKETSPADGANDSELTKIVKASPGV